MSFRQTALAFVIAAAAAPAAFAEAGQWVNGEIGFVPAPAQSTLTREQVRSELFSFIKRGGQTSVGERGYVDAAATAPVRSAERVDVRRMGSAATLTMDPYANGGPN
ncbi:DUF4148 domain-containing protein [Ramlibacter sp. RBP-2]|uniref:DUF4148 domain-containing protein n=1 Tax=Ramlibacter lithotrophicus TaxID=2606681 RepID=A0A7X6DEV6_9BURK|nr:DUF4148 domain-containing protein [Ramlibacter lithotrophicus]NKE65885.1 DUF4148 domain-containing protein [Ramlibacter lithotrophicus]